METLSLNKDFLNLSRSSSIRFLPRRKGIGRFRRSENSERRNRSLSSWNSLVSVAKRPSNRSSTVTLNQCSHPSRGSERQNSKLSKMPRSLKRRSKRSRKSYNVTRRSFLSKRKPDLN